MMSVRYNIHLKLKSIRIHLPTEVVARGRVRLRSSTSLVDLAKYLWMMVCAGKGSQTTC